MATRRKPAAPPPDEPWELRRKYAELCEKYATLARRLQDYVHERSDAWRLGWAALRATTAGLAVVDHGQLVLANLRWRKLERMAGSWRELAGTSAPVRRFPSLRALAEHGEAWLREEGKEAVARFTHDGRDVVLEVRVKSLTRRQVVLIANDITGQLRAERQLAHARNQLLHEAHLRALARIAACGAHDLRNALRAATFSLDALEAQVSEEARREHVQAVRRATTHAEAAAQRMLTLFRGPSDTSEDAPLAAAVAEAVNLFEQDPPRDPPIRLRVAVPRRLRVRVTSAAELAMAFFNLLINARDALAAGGTVVVRAAQHGRRVTVEVADDGQGIAPEHLAHLFEPFFSTKGGRGAGLGLAMVYGFMLRVGGAITAANRPAGGALFRLDFPVADVASAADRSTRRRGPAAARARSASAPRGRRGAGSRRAG